MKLKPFMLTASVLGMLISLVSAQDAPPVPQAVAQSARETGNQLDATREPRRRPDVMGIVSAINGQTLTIKNPEGREITVTVTDTTRYMKDRQPAKFADFKVGDMAMVRGRSTGTDAWEAAFLGSQGSGFGNRGPNGFSQGGLTQGLGKKFIAGQIKSIDGTHLTITRMDGETQTIAVDENTSFKKEGESITLADFKAGDHVFGPGELKDGTFVASRLMIGDMHRMRGGPEGNRGLDQVPDQK